MLCVFNTVLLAWKRRDFEVISMYPYFDSYKVEIYTKAKDNMFVIYV
jgi:hypothetical protein